MDNRLRFLYLMITELWGRRKKAGAGNGTRCKRGTRRVGKTALLRGRRDADRNISREARELAAEKSRYCLS